jgi:hypothetical protein
MATEEQIKKAIKSDGASEHRDSLPEEKRKPRFSGNGLPKFVEEMPRDKAQRLARILSPSSWQE